MELCCSIKCTRHTHTAITNKAVYIYIYKCIHIRKVYVTRRACGRVFLQKGSSSRTVTYIYITYIIYIYIECIQSRTCLVLSYLIASPPGIFTQPSPPPPTRSSALCVLSRYTHNVCPYTHTVCHLPYTHTVFHLPLYTLCDISPMHTLCAISLMHTLCSISPIHTMSISIHTM